MRCPAAHLSSQQYLHAGLIDELHIAIGPILIGGGERLFDNLGGGVHGYECVAFDNLSGVGHARLTRSSQGGA